MIDRLERDGNVRRELDPHDRRRVIVRVVPERYQEGAVYFEPMRQAAPEVYARFTDEELAVVVDFLRRSHKVAVQEVARLQSGTPSAGGSGSPPNKV